MLAPRLKNLNVKIISRVVLQPNIWKKISMDSEVLYERIIHENEAKAFQLRLVLNEFREKQYLHLRKYFQSFEGDWIPTKEGASMEASIQNIYNLLDGILELLSTAEGVDGIEEYFGNKISDLKSKTI